MTRLRQFLREMVQSVFARQVTTTFATRIAGLAVSVISAVIMARWLGREGKGAMAMAMLLPTTFQVFLTAGIGVANVYFVGSRRRSVAEMSSNSVAFALMASGLGFLVFLALWATGLVGVVVPGVSILYVVLGMLTLPFLILTEYLQAILQGLRRITTLNILSIAQACIVVPLVALFLMGLGLGVFGGVLAGVLASMTVLLLTGIFARREGAVFRPRWQPDVVRSTLRFGMKGQVGNMLQFFNYRLDMFIVNIFLGPAGVGIYGVSVQLAELLWNLPNAVAFVIFPKAAATERADMNRFTPRVMWGTLGFCVLGAGGLALFGKLAIRILFSSEFLEAYVPMLLLLPGVVLLGGAKVLCNDLAGRGYPHYNSINAGLSLIATIVLDLLLIGPWGVAGASIASSVAYGITFLLALAFYRSVCRTRQDVSPLPPGVHEPEPEASRAGAIVGRAQACGDADV
jgi:O-antigen/teichoic acid export membrane protein